jgi:cysteinyl-tRNA synthetase
MTPQLKLYNTLTRVKEDFTPIDEKNVRMYVCGPTVYQRIHIGNARPIIVFDVLFRLLRHLYGEKHVTYVRNITDIDDKIIAEARKNNETIEAVTERTTAQFLLDTRTLGCLEPSFQPRATDHIAGMAGLIGQLIERGHAYEAEGHVLFNVPSMPDYGRLSGRNRDDQIAGARVDVAPYKKDPADFVLWKPSTPDQPGWDSPWGRGRPGWHLECSAMAERLLGVPFDIHGGGLDLVFPHHENEIAQTRCAHGLDRMANYWLHNGFVDMRGQKMAKSVGNVVRVDEALATVPGEAIRFWLLGTHYRQPIDCSDEALKEAKRTLDRFYLALRKADLGASDEGEVDAGVISAMADDLNTGQAIARLHVMLDRVNTTRIQEKDEAAAGRLAADLRASGRVLGLFQSQENAFLQAANTLEDQMRTQIIEKVTEREDARKRKDYSRADEIRHDLWEGYHVILEDRPDGSTEWRRRS